MAPCFTLINTDNCNLEDYQPLSFFFFFKAISDEKDAILLPETGMRKR